MIESVDADVYLEGVRCTISRWGRAFVAMKMATLKVLSAVGDRFKPMFRRLLKKLATGGDRTSQAICPKMP